MMKLFDKGVEDDVDEAGKIESELHHCTSLGTQNAAMSFEFSALKVRWRFDHWNGKENFATGYG